MTLGERWLYEVSTFHYIVVLPIDIFPEGTGENPLSDNSTWIAQRLAGFITNNYSSFCVNKCKQSYLVSMYLKHVNRHTDISIFKKRNSDAEQSNSDLKIHYPHLCVVFKGHVPKNIALLAFS